MHTSKRTFRAAKASPAKAGPPSPAHQAGLCCVLTRPPCPAILSSLLASCPMPAANLYCYPRMPDTHAQPPRQRKLLSNSRGLTQAYELRDLAADAATALRQLSRKPDGTLAMDHQTAASLAKLVSAWDCARQAIRVYRGQGNPKPVEAKNARKRKSKASTPPPPA